MYESMDVTRTVDKPMREFLTQFQDLAFVAGSAARRVVMGPKADEPHDIDLFLYDRDSFSDVCDTLQSLGYGEQVRRLAVTYVRPSIVGDSIPVQVVIPTEDEFQRTFGEPEAVLSQFAFTAQQFAVEAKDGKIRATYSVRAINDARSRRLKVASIGSPILVAWAAMKYTAKGYFLEPSDLAELFTAWESRDATYKARAVELARNTGIYPAGMELD